MFKKKSTIFLLVLIFLLTATVSFGFFFYRSGKLQGYVLQKAVDNFSSTNTSGPDMDFLRSLLGFDKPRTYLLIFLNNTEMRPGGGFIGVYAVVRVNNAVPEIIKVEGTEILDNNAPKDFTSVPPAPISKYMDVERWYFRDSNWSPDFASSSEKGLELYTKERGLYAESIDTVIGFTPTVLEKLLKIIGPITVDGITFTSENFTEKLEYEVEYGYADKNISFDERKKILNDLAKKIITTAGKNVFSSWVNYKGLFEDMTRERQIMLYSRDTKLQEKFLSYDWVGEMKKTDGDYFIWVDANLGALKTDHAMERQLKYEIFKKDQKYFGRLTMNYKHTGVFDWRTSRYLSYTRVFVPKGSKLSSDAKDIDQGKENNRQWFGTFISIEPGKSKSVMFEFELAPQIVEKIIQNDYSLYCQKQLGTNRVGLTVKLEFDKKVVASTPRENKGVLTDKLFEYATVLDNDKFFKVNLE